MPWLISLMNEQPDKWITANDYHESSICALAPFPVPWRFGPRPSSRCQDWSVLRSVQVARGVWYLPTRHVLRCQFFVQVGWSRMTDARKIVFIQGKTTITEGTARWPERIFNNQKLFTKAEWTLGSGACCSEIFSSEFWIPQNVAPDFCRDANIQIQPREKQTEMVCWSLLQSSHFDLARSFLAAVLAFIMVLVPKLPGQRLLIQRVARTMARYTVLILDNLTMKGSLLLLTALNCLGMLLETERADKTKEHNNFGYIFYALANLEYTNTRDFLIHGQVVSMEKMVGRIQKVTEVQVKGPPSHLRAGLGWLMLRLMGPKWKSSWIWVTNISTAQYIFHEFLKCRSLQSENQ